MAKKWPKDVAEYVRERAPWQRDQDVVDGLEAEFGFITSVGCLQTWRRRQNPPINKQYASHQMRDLHLRKEEATRARHYGLEFDGTTPS